MADYNANIRVNADTKGAERQISKLEKTLNKLSDFSLKLNSRDISRQVGQLGQQLQGIGERGAIGGLTLAAGKATTALAGLGAKFGVMGAAAASAGAAINSALGGVPAVVGDILNQVGHIPNAFGLAAVAALAFAPQVTKAAAAATGLGAAIDKAVGPKAVAEIAGLTDGIGQLNMELNATKSAFGDLLANTALSKLTRQLEDAQRQVNRYVAFTSESVTAVEQLLTVERLVTQEKRAQAALINQVNRDARVQRAVIEQNLFQSRNSRAGSGFASFSRAAVGIEGSRAVDKSIRRNWERRMRNAAANVQPMSGPLALPSTDMLFAGGRRIQRLTEDPGIAAGRAFTRQLQDAVRPAQQLDGIFKAVEKSLGYMTRNVEVGARTQRSWRDALREMKVIQEQLNPPIRPGTQYANPIGPQRAPTGPQRPSLIGRRLGDSLSNAAIGASFPLLFGQSGSAAVGGAVGGAVGSLFGGTAGFAGSLLGTMLGEVADRGKRVKELAQDLGFSAEQTQMLAKAFQQAGRDFDKFAESANTIRGLTTDLETQSRAIQLASTLTEVYGGKIDKVTNAFAAALQNGKVTQATLNQLTAQGIPIQDALAARYDISRTKLLQMVKDGQVSTQSLIDTLVQLGNEGVTAANKSPDAFTEGFSRIRESLGELYNTFVTTFAETSKVISESTGEGVRGALEYINDFIRGLQRIVEVVGPVADTVVAAYLRIEKSIIGAILRVPDLTNAVLSFVGTVIGPLGIVAGAIDKIRGIGANRPERQGPYLPDRLQRAPLKSFTVPSALPAGGGAGKGKKPPEDRTAQLREELQAIIAIGEADNEIRDLLFQGKEIKAADYELAKKLADIERDKQKALLQANYASEKRLITETAIARTTIARLENEDRIREIMRKQNQEKIALKLASDQDRMQLQQDLAGLTLPTEASPMEQLLIQQTNRRDQLFSARLAELDQLQTKLSAPEGTFNSRQISEFQSRLSAVNDEIGQLTTAVAELDAAEIAWEKSRAGAEALRDTVNGIGNEVRNGLVTALTTAVTATSNLSDAMRQLSADILQAIGQQLILNAITGALKGLGGSDGVGLFSILAGTFTGGKRAAGGPVLPGVPYLVGENGPELFVPGRTGNVVRADQTQELMASRGALGSGGSRSSTPVDANPDTITTTTSTFNASREALSTTTSPFNANREVLSTTALLSRERYVERVLKSGASSAEIKYSRVGSGDLPFVTEADMLQATRLAAQEGARMGQQRTLAALKNNPASRRTIGI